MGVWIADDRFEAGLEVGAGGGPRDQAEELGDGVGVVALLFGWKGGVATLLIER